MRRRLGCRVRVMSHSIGVPEPRRALPVVAVLGAMALAVLDAAITNVALPSMARSLQVEPGMSVWIVTAYQAALVMALLPCAALGESIGQRRVFAGGVALFTAASVLCALSPSLAWLVAARFLQGLGAAGVMALGISLLRAVVAPGQLGAAIGWNALVVALSSAAGPAIGSAILFSAGWPRLFALNLPLGALVLLGTRALPEVPGTARPLDALSVGLYASCLAALVVGAQCIASTPAPASALLATAAIGLTALVRREMAKAAPLIPLDLLRTHSIRTSVVASVCCFAGITIGLVSLPFYLQHTLGLDTLTTGLYMTAWPLAVAAAAPLAGRLAERVPTAHLCAIGAGLLAAGLAAASLWDLGERPLALVPLTMLCGVGFGLFQVPNNRNMFLAAPLERSGAAGGMQGTARLAGQTAGSVMMGLLFTVASIDAAPRLGLRIAAVLALAAGVASALRTRTVARPC